VAPVVYFPFAQNIAGAFSLVVRTNGDPASTTRSVRAAVSELDPDLPVYLIRTMPQILEESDAVFVRRQVLVLLAMFATAALAVAAAGIYGLLAQLVAQQTRELAVRIALGAARLDIVRLVLRRGLAPAAAGVFLGLALAAAGTRALDSLLYEVSPLDPLSLVGVSVLLLGIALSSCLLPTWRACRVNPAMALREEIPASFLP
jgi:ABC-type antimicrobial peptide transport system permease subunit